MDYKSCGIDIGRIIQKVGFHYKSSLKVGDFSLRCVKRGRDILLIVQHSNEKEKFKHFVLLCSSPKTMREIGVSQNFQFSFL